MKGKVLKTIRKTGVLHFTQFIFWLLGSLRN